MIKFSLVVATLNRTEELANLLESLIHQTYKNFEVIVVDQNDSGVLDEIVTVYSNRLAITRIHCESKGASHARNQGIAIAQGEIITFPDDDCEYPSDLLEKVCQEFAANDVSGITLSSHDKEGDGRIARLATKRKYIHKYNLYKTCIEAAMFIYKSCLEDVRFDENLGVGSPTMLWSDEGPDFLLRLMLRGHRFLYAPALYIYHPDPVKLYDEKSIIRSYRYGCGRGAYLRKNSYPLWFVFYVWALYVAGIFIGVAQGKPNKSRYFFSGLKGRVKGYLFLDTFLQKAPLVTVSKAN